MRKVSQTRQFSRDLKRVAKRGKNLDKLKRVVILLAKDQPLEPRHRDHALTGTGSTPVTAISSRIGF